MSVSLERGIDNLIEQIDAPIASFFTSCVHCGMCADACLFYTETQDPKYTPIYKLHPLRKIWKQEYTFWGKLLSKLGIGDKLTDAELAEWETLVYDSCTLCGRCSTVCPVGNDITYMIRKLREGMVTSGHSPEGLRGATKRSVELGSPMGVSLKTLQAQMKASQSETGLEVPLDKEGADYMLVLSSAEIAMYAEIIPAVTRIFDHAGVSWTLCSEAFEGTNAGIQIGSRDIAAELLNRIVRGAEKLKVKTVISPECGHAYTALRWEGPNLIGRPYPFKVMHLIEVLDQLRAEGRLKTVSKEDMPITFHDPCQMVRRGGVVAQPRNLLGMFATDFREMDEHGVQGWCCGGGGGVSANERAEPLRRKVFSRKRHQLDGLGVRAIVTSCSNCRHMIEDGLEDSSMENIEVLSLTELLAEHLPEANIPASGE